MAVIFQILVVFTAVQRIGELFWSKRNESRILAKGGQIVPELTYVFMVILHTSWIVGLLYLAVWNNLEFDRTLFGLGVVLFFVGQTLRLSAILSLGERWSTRILILPYYPAVRRGPFKWIKHPNYLGVVLELFALPLCAGELIYALVFSVLNFVILYFRIKKEESFLKKYNEYEKIFN